MAGRAEQPLWRTSAGRIRRPAVVLAAAVALSVGGAGVIAGVGGDRPSRRNSLDHVAERTGAAGTVGSSGHGASASEETAAGSSSGHAPAPTGGGTSGEGGTGAGPADASGAGGTAGGPSTGTGSTGTGAGGTGPAGTTAPSKTPRAPGGAPGQTPTSRPAPRKPAVAPGWRAFRGAPIGGRFGHAAVWTGREMVVWGGQADWDTPSGNDGAAYDPATATWRRVAPAPLSGRSHALAVWTGREVLLWGGLSDDAEVLADGAAWDPATNRWRRIPDSPLGPRDGAAVVWTGDAAGGDPGAGRLVVWGGVDWQDGQERGDGVAYDPAAGRWSPLAAAPISPRAFPQAGWTGSRVVISGGVKWDDDGTLADGAAWDPATNTWRTVAPRPAGGACDPEETCAVVWTGTRLLLFDSGLAYDPAADRWHPLARSPLEDKVWVDESTVWTGSRMVTWGGRREDVDDQGVAVPGGPTGAVYDPAADRWSELEQGPLGSRSGHTAVWTGEDMLVWGGWTADVGLADGAAYRPAG